MKSTRNIAFPIIGGLVGWWIGSQLYPVNDSNNTNQLIGILMFAVIGAYAGYKIN